MSEEWTTEKVPVEAYDRLHAQLVRAERLLSEIRDGKHSVPGLLVQIDRYFAERGASNQDSSIKREAIRNARRALSDTATARGSS